MNAPLALPCPSTAPETVAVLVHHVVRADEAIRDAEGQLAHAERLISQHGLSLPTIRKALAMLQLDAAVVQADQQAVCEILVALRAAEVELDPVEVVERIVDEDVAVSLGRAARAGFCAAALNRACDGGGHVDGSPRHIAWVDGWRAFRRELARFADRPKSRRKVAA